MGEIDWKRYAQLCEDSTAPAIERFGRSLRTASGVATNQSIPIYTGSMKGCLVTSLRQMTDILKNLSADSLTPEEQKKIHWKSVEDWMREAYFEKLSGIDNMVIAVDYIHTRIQNKPSDQEGIYKWVAGLQGQKDEIERITSRVMEATNEFASRDVPKMMETARMGIRPRRQDHTG